MIFTYSSKIFMKIQLIYIINHFNFSFYIFNDIIFFKLYSRIFYKVHLMKYAN